MTTLTALRLTDFRSYASLDVRPNSRIVALEGPNGSGKTNLLEAISVLAPGRGLRGAKFTELARRGASGGWAVAAQLTDAGRRFTLGTGIDGAGAERRKILLDGDPVNAAAAAAAFACVWLTPQMDRLFTEGASARRRFLDRLTLALAPAHASEVAAFEAASANRNRQIEQGTADAAWLATIEDSMARHAAALTASRLDLIARVNAMLARGAFAPFPAATLALECPIGARLAIEPAIVVEDWLRRLYARTRAEPVAAVSPQRADLLLADAGSGLAAAFASTGQQRAMLVAIVLAHAALIASLRGAAPVLLLDEPFVHLDAAHRVALGEALQRSPSQVFCTATDRAQLRSLGDDAAIWLVSPGRIIGARSGDQDGGAFEAAGA
ncbi:MULTISPECIES: DNA replication/repair protein RecF [Acidiphilium]|uniref:DNA replication and repair protein RecF n=1 Tax=Acidiphilium rubrum TaxID=526 RepID=A0A8G2CJY7_ACIRU|nr:MULTISPECIES: DNA replication/repair protein RecF [Acidiphilium]SIQ63652.1 DNA replication and repair protein RecF [Acidiphilium rubrum]